MDGGALFVPPSDAASFINALAAEVVRGVPRHVVERRTPVFRLFFDLDAHVSDGCEPDWAAVLDVLCRAALECFEAADDAAAPLALACRAPRRRLPADRSKCGFHVHFPRVVVSSPVAMAVRARCLDALQAAFPDALANDWASALDAAVFHGSGLRLPWMRKGRSADPSAVYAPWRELDAAGRWLECDPEAALASVSTVRRYLGLCSIRCADAPPTAIARGALADAVLLELDEADETGAASVARFGGRHVSTAKYADALHKLDEVLPVQFIGQRVTAVIELDSVFFLRSSSRYCLNIGRPHSTNNVFFLLRPGGICQKCYCRCNTLDGRRSGKLCKDFSSELWPVPLDVTSAFFGSKFLDDAPIMEHPEAGLHATRSMIERQKDETQLRKRRRVLPSVRSQESLSVASMFQRSASATAAPRRRLRAEPACAKR